MPTITSNSTFLDLSAALRGIVGIDQMTGIFAFSSTTSLLFIGTNETVTLGGFGLTNSGSPVVPTAGTITSIQYAASPSGASATISGLNLSGVSFGATITIDAVGIPAISPPIQSAIENALFALDYTINGTGQADSYRALNSADGTALILAGANTFNWGAGADLMEVGGSGNDTILGGTGNDTLTGGGGVDSILGGDDNDLIRPGSNGLSTNEFFDGEGGIDTFSLEGLSFAVGYTLNLDTGQVVFINNAAASGTLLRFENATGSEQGDNITGNTLGNVLRGGGGADNIVGGGGDDTLIGGAGADNLNGGADNDLFLVQSPGISAGETMSGGTGNDTLSLAGLGFDYVIDLDAETINIAAGGFAGEVRGIEVIIGGSVGDSITGAGVAETLRGEDGADTLTGGGGADSLEGGANGDSLSGGLGDDTLVGGAGNDNLGTVSFADGGDVLFGGADDDRIFFDTTTAASVSYFGLTNLYQYDDAVAGTGLTNTFAIDGIETIVAGDGNDLLEGNATTRRLEGGNGDDLIRLQTIDTTADGGGGTDTLDLGNLLFATVVDLGTAAGLTGFENLNLTTLADGGTGTGEANRMDGRSGDDTLTGLGGNDRLIGGTGLDALDGGNDNDTLDGGDDNDALTGGDGSDSLAGGSGADSVQGGVGIDTLLGDDGNDTLRGGDSTDRLDGGLDNDDLFGDRGNDVLFGRAGLDQLFGGDANDTLQGEAGSDLLLGDGGLDQLFGGADADTLIGGAGGDTLAGGGGADTLIGGAQNDVYRVDATGDRVVETVNITSIIDAGGVDRVEAAVSFNMSTGTARFVENLVLTGSLALSGTGNGLANTLTGNGGANALNGLAGRDVLTGGGGRDAFVFSTALGATNIDRITDFSTVLDTIRIDNAVFRGLTEGALARTAFVANITGTAADSSDRIIYETDTGNLYFDRDGAGGTARVQFAQLTGGLAVTHLDFLVI
jgi:serralysin